MSDLPEGWRWATIDELKADEPGAITDGPFGSKLTSAHYSQDGARVVRLQNIGTGIYRSADAFISWPHFANLRKHEVRAHDLLIASLGEDPPRACLAPESLGPAIVKADCVRVRLSGKVDSRWVMYAMQNPTLKRWAADQLHGVGRPRLGLKTIRQLPIPLPPLEEQRRIVDLLEDHLSRLDAADAYVSASEARTKSLTRSILESAIPMGGRAGWRMTTVGRAGRLQLGRARHPDWHNGPEMRPYLRVANVFEDRVVTDDVMQMDFFGVFEKYRLHPGDILLNEGQSPHLLGRPAMYRGEPEDVAFTNSLIRFQAAADVLPEWALLVFRRHMHSGRFRRESRITTNIAHLSMARLKEVEFPIPPLEEQARRVERASEALMGLARMRENAAQARKRSEGLRRALLESAFSGRLTGRSADTDVAVHLVGATS